MSNLNFIAPILSTTSYGLVSINILKELSNLGEKIALFPINKGQEEAPDRFHESIRKALKSAEFPDWNAPCIRLWHQFDMSQFVGRGKRIGYPIFELDTFNTQEKHHLSSLDEIFVCSAWAKDVILKNLSDIKSNQVHIVPLGIDPIIFSPSVQHKLKNTVFLTAGKWEVRKSHQELIECFNKAFELEDDVELWMVCENIFNSKEENEKWFKLAKESKLGSKIRLFPRLDTQEQLSQLMNASDYGIFLSKAEGFNLEALEMLACGKKIIVTDVTAHTEFCNNKNSYLISCPEKELAQDGKWFFGQGNWHKFGEEQKEQTIQFMRYLHSCKEQNQENIDGIETAKKFSWANTARIIKGALDV